MLQIDQIDFIDKNQNIYTIKKQQLEQHFPLVGGTAANMITTRVWNQHGNSFIDSYMEPIDDEIVFVLYTRNKSEIEQEEQRRIITNICNPLNGILTMKVYFNTGKIYNRDITFTSAPVFPIGFENRNNVWQKVQLLYTANNPFWYSEIETVESFKNADPNFTFPFEMSATAPIEFGFVIPSKIAINSGQVEAPVIIKIVGACVNPLITNLTTGEFIKFKNLSMDSNDELIIDTRFGQKKVTLNNENVFNKLDFSSSFFNLVLGENIIDFEDDTDSTTASVHFIYRNLYITI